VPIIVAAMGQLNKSGGMHNRCLMIVASYLVKDLIVDWCWGERRFRAQLVVGDLAAKNGGWQWSASSSMNPERLQPHHPRGPLRSGGHLHPHLAAGTRSAVNVVLSGRIGERPPRADRGAQAAVVALQGAVRSASNLHRSNP
jgi:deoxyribodipyrimidine photo-lyase